MNGQIRVTFRGTKSPEAGGGPGVEVHGYIVAWSANLDHVIVAVDSGLFHRVPYTALRLAPEVVTGGAMLPVGKADR